MAIDQFDHVLFDGNYITRRQRQAFLQVEKDLGISLLVYQGSWRPQTSYSGTTHTKAGVCDLYVYGMSSQGHLRNNVTKSLRKVGCQAAFLRGPFVDMPWHWHVCDLNTRHMDSNAIWQVGEYRKGNDGLVAGRDDPFPYRPRPIRVYDYQKVGDHD